MSQRPLQWRCPHCRNKKCRVHDRNVGTLPQVTKTTCFGWKRQAIKDAIRELKACERRKRERGL